MSPRKQTKPDHVIFQDWCRRQEAAIVEIDDDVERERATQRYLIQRRSREIQFANAKIANQAFGDLLRQED